MGAGGVSGQPGPPAVVTDPEAPPPPAAEAEDTLAVPAPAARLDAVDLEAFFDGYMAAYLHDSGVVGGVVAVVERGRLVFAKGYGDADLAADREVDPERTLFRIGSVSKLFVWTSVMQQVEAGKLDLDADVNRYLYEIEVPQAFGKPITLAHLMTHTAGFEDRVIGLFSHDAETVRPLVEVLSEGLPARVRPPGELASYSNHGSALAAHVVERVSGQPFDDYVEEHILEPLGMRSTTFRQPVPERLRAELSEGYRKAATGVEAAGFEYIPLAPAGAASASATDMARFMIAHLQRGRLGEARILSEPTAERMQRPLHRHQPSLPGMAHGWIEGDRNGHRTIGHLGDTLWFHTLLELYFDQDIGIFASFNTEGAETLGLGQAFADHVFPAPPWTPPEPAADWTERARHFVGPYRSLCYSHHDFTKLMAAATELRVADAGDGVLRLSSQPERRWVQVGPLRFRDRDGTATLIFDQGPGGGIRHLYLSELPVWAYERVPLLERRSIHAALASGALALFAVTLALLPLIVFARRDARRGATARSRLPSAATATLWLACLVLVVFVVAFALAGADPASVVFGLAPGVQRLLLLPIAAVALAGIALLCTVWIWRGRRGGVVARLGYTLVVVALWVVIWQLAVWRLLGSQS